MRSKIVFCLTLLLGLATLISGPIASAQDSPNPTIAPMSDLSSALPANEWSRVEASVDAGLRWLPNTARMAASQATRSLNPQ
ncbi:MAG: hypothetical protein O3C40_37840 [Planctomycetota bacterium]|nr:hypothetical protein [Planctomycetota bacterium]